MDAEQKRLKEDTIYAREELAYAAREAETESEHNLVLSYRKLCLKNSIHPIPTILFVDDLADDFVDELADGSTRNENVPRTVSDPKHNYIFFYSRMDEVATSMEQQLSMLAHETAHILLGDNWDIDKQKDIELKCDRIAASMQGTNAFIRQVRVNYQQREENLSKGLEGALDDNPELKKLLGEKAGASELKTGQPTHEESLANIDQHPPSDRRELKNAAFTRRLNHSGWLK